MPVTIRELAKLAGVSPSTVSRALDDSCKVKPETKKRIQELAVKYNCKKNLLASGLFSGKSKSIGVILPDVEYPFFSSILTGIEEKAKSHDCAVIISISDNDPESEQKSIDMMAERRVDGLIIASIQDQLNVQDFWKLQKDKVPFVLIDRQLDNVDTDFVGSNDYQEAFDAVDYLIKLGHSSIACLRGPLDISTSQDRFLGYKKALSDNNCIYDSSIVKEVSFKAKHHRESDKFDPVEELIESIDKFTAIFAFTDSVAFKAFSMLKSIGIRVPEDISIVGYGDLEFATFLDKPLTTVWQPKTELGKRAAEILYNRIYFDDQKNVEAVKEIMDVRLVIRKTTSKFVDNELL